MMCYKQKQRGIPFICVGEYAVFVGVNFIHLSCCMGFVQKDEFVFFSKKVLNRVFHFSTTQNLKQSALRRGFTQFPQSFPQIESNMSFSKEKYIFV